MRISRDRIHVIKSDYDEHSFNYWYKIVVDIPQLHLETPNFNTVEYGEELKQMILDTEDYCPHCKKRI